MPLLFKWPAQIQIARLISSCKAATGYYSIYYRPKNHQQIQGEEEKEASLFIKSKRLHSGGDRISIFQVLWKARLLPTQSLWNPTRVTFLTPRRADFCGHWQYLLCWESNHRFHHFEIKTEPRAKAIALRVKPTLAIASFSSQSASSSPGCSTAHPAPG